MTALDVEAAADEFLYGIGFQKHLLSRFLKSDRERQTFSDDFIVKEADVVGDSDLFRSGSLLAYGIMHEVKCSFTGQKMWIGWNRVARCVMAENDDGSALSVIWPYEAEDGDLPFTDFNECWVRGEKFFIDFAMLLRLSFRIDVDDYHVSPTGSTRPIT